jgi:signal transduction histidine kinase
MSLPIIPVTLPIYHQIAILCINFASSALLLAVFNHNRFRDKQSRIFVGLGISMMLWVDFAYLARIFGTNQSLSELLLRIAWVATPPTFYFTYLTSIFVIQKEKEHKKERYMLLWLTAILSILTAFTNVIISGAIYQNQNLDIIYGIGFFPFLAVIALLMAATLRPLLHTKLNQSARMFLLGVLLFYILNLVFNISLPVFFRISYLYFFGDYSTILLLGCTSYAILRYKLFQIQIVATEAITGLLWILLFGRLLISPSATQGFVDGLVFLLAVVFGVFLVRSVLREVKQRERLQELTEKLKLLDKQKDEFISVAAHELRAPMTAIKGYLSMIIDGDAGIISDEARSFINHSIEGNDRLIRLVNNMLNVSRIEENRMVYEMGIVSLKHVVEEVYREFEASAKEQSLHFSIDESHVTYDMVSVDKDRIYEVVANYVSNAIKYTDQGSVAVTLTNPSSDCIRFEATDTGYGMTENEQKKLFNKFVRADSSAKKAVGTGLGLYICKLLVEKFGGKIGVISTLGKGSTFWFELPIQKV